MLARRKIGTGAAIATGVILAAVLTGSASADPSPVVPFKNCAQARAAGDVPVLASDPRFQPGLDRNHNGIGCEDADTSSVISVGLGVHAGAKTVVDTPSCPDATASLVQARVIVGGLNGKGGTSSRLEAARKADKDARNKAHVDQAADKVEDTDYGTSNADAADANLSGDITERDNAVKALADANALPNDNKPITDTTGKAYKVQQAGIRLENAQKAITRDQSADAAEDGIGVEEIPADSQDTTLAADKAAIDGPNGTAAKLKAAENAEGTAEQGIVDAEVVIGQACKTPPPPAPPTADTPAPQPSVITGGNPGPITIINGQAPAPQIVAGNLPVTG